LLTINCKYEETVQICLTQIVETVELQFLQPAGVPHVNSLKQALFGVNIVASFANSYRCPDLPCATTRHREKNRT
jgi:hypothetical protein